MVDFGPPTFSLGPNERLSARIVRAMFVIGALSALFRFVDFIMLLRRPALLRAAVVIWWTGIIHTPYEESSFARAHSARRAGISTTELVYGETPMLTAWRGLRAAGLGPSSKLVDLGAGRGRVLLAARMMGAEAVGIELLSTHVDVVKAPLASVGIDIRQGTLATADLTDATHVFVTWTCLGDKARSGVVECLRQLSVGAHVITASWPIDDDGFEHVERLRAWFTWGPGELFVQRRV